MEDIDVILPFVLSHLLCFGTFKSLLRISQKLITWCSCIHTNKDDVYLPVSCYIICAMHFCILPYCSNKDDVYLPVSCHVVSYAIFKTSVLSENCFMVAKTVNKSSQQSLTDDHTNLKQLTNGLGGSQ